MSDPISMIATGAAIGGLASKFAEKAWDSAENWLKTRFSQHSIQAQEQARKNAAKFVHQLAIRLSELESKHQGTSFETNESSLKNPQFSVLLQRTIFNAAQTSDDGKADLLAGLVAQRLYCNEDSTVALASKLASDAIVSSTSRQLKIMAACVLIDEITPKYAFQETTHFCQWIATQFRTFKDLEFKESDARHLVAIACAIYDSTSGKSLDIFLHLKAGKYLIELMDDSLFKDIPELEAVKCAWMEGLAGVQLTSVGSIVGGLALTQLKGVEIGLPNWD